MVDGSKQPASTSHRKHGAATPRLISSHPPRPWKGLGKAGRLPSAAAGVNTTAAVLGLPEYQRITIHGVLALMDQY